ncbi:hypothetical protein UFOVP728_43 [uncultured Caudovirales phage]|uniref:Uncharacterized protein n=1 Tax=uncultured Caudovirales phage TaxID=2100421 RepID=A0A6J5NPS5_9CAUD|nr:hypothetical protein UFOVP728_43 [uncultured Caudovirales phage]
MCLFDAPDYPAPQQYQDAKMPNNQAASDPAGSARRNMRAQGGGMAASTLLTGPSGVENNALALGRTTLLGQ